MGDLWCCSDLGDSFQKHLESARTEDADSGETRMNVRAGTATFEGLIPGSLLKMRDVIR